uniref:Immunoglobulin domain-containing protein n=1 Tax=Sparus aurata TaxID=8175 RepID=A0A671Y587_SPAAU
KKMSFVLKFCQSNQMVKYPSITVKQYSLEHIQTFVSRVSAALCGQFKIIIPKTIEVLSGSCVTIPCSFDVPDQYYSCIDETCRALWKYDQQTFVFDSSNPQSSGHLTSKDCSTTLNNMRPEHSKEYFFRVQCDQLKHSFLDQKLYISVTDVPPTPTLTPSTLKVEEGTSVSLKCSAPAPCLCHPPPLTWSSSLGHIQESLQENQDRTKVQTSVLTFTASHLHHGKEISCTAVYNKQDGMTKRKTHPNTVSVSPSGPVPEDTDVTLTCSSAANPAVKNYTWYRADRSQETVMGTEHVLNIKASRDSGPFFCDSENAIGSGRSNSSQIDVHCNGAFRPNAPDANTIASDASFASRQTLHSRRVIILDYSLHSPPGAYTQLQLASPPSL